MNIFKLIKSVLDELYALIEGYDDEKDRKINARLEKFHQEYSNIRASINIDYNDPVSRFAYIFKYVTSHANIVFDIIRNSGKLKECFIDKRLVVTCLGGGPGSDFLGIMKYMTRYRKDSCLYCNMMDNENAWCDPWMDVDEKAQAEFRISTRFVPFDITDEASWRLHPKTLQADLFTLIYFLSEISSKKAESNHYFYTLFLNAKKGAKFLFVDNANSAFYNWFDEMAHSNGITIQESSNYQEAQMPSEEEASDLGPYFVKFGKPKLKTFIAYRIGAKL